MAEPGPDPLDLHLSALLERLDELRRRTVDRPLPPARAELRTLHLWRSVISECLSSFFYVFTVCGAAAGVASGGSTAETILAASFAAGFSIAALTQSFGHVSGAQVNPAVSIAMALTRHISILRGVMFVVAQCGGGIAGAALLYGVTVPGRQGTLSAAVAQLPAHLSPWERFGLELILTFVVVFTYFVSMDSHRKYLGGTALAIGSAYLAASIVSMPYLNPARALGPAFVMNKWDNHWVYWFGPIMGGIAAGLIYEFIFNPRRHFKRSKDSIDGDSSSIHSDEDTYDELDKPRSAYNTLRPVQPGADLYRPVGTSSPSGRSPSGGQNYCAQNMVQASLYAAPPCKLDRVESLYGGTKSLYCKSPPLTRANLNRSQSVYTKSTGPPMLHRTDNGVPRPGPLVPAQSLYPMRLNTNGTGVASANQQNQQNQQRLGAEGIYGTRPVNQADRIYRKLPGRPESVYGQRQEPTDGAYQYQGPPAPRGAANYAPVPKPVAYHPMQARTADGEVGLPNQAPPPYMRGDTRETPSPQAQQAQQLQQQQQQQAQQMQQQQQQQQQAQQFRDSPSQAPPQQYRESPNPQYRESPNPQYRESPNPQYIRQEQPRESPSQNY